MRKLLFASVMLLALLPLALTQSCKKKEEPNKDLVGSWQLSQVGIGTTMIDLASPDNGLETLQGMLSGQFPNLPPEAFSELRHRIGMASQALKALSCEVKKDGSFAINTPSLMVTGSWTRSGNAVTFRVDPGLIPSNATEPAAKLTRKLLVDTPPTCNLENGKLVHRLNLTPFFDMAIEQLAKPAPNETPEEARQREGTLAQIRAIAQIARLIPLSLVFSRT